MKNLINTILLAGLTTFYSCSPTFYSPNAQHVPLLSQKGETALTLAGNGNQVEFHGAYALTDHFALKANAGWFIPRDLDNGNGGSGKLVELGGGYFQPIHDNWIFEAYGQIGFGGFENHLPSTSVDYPNTKGNISANMLRIGIQPNFGYKSKYFTAALSARIANLSYSKIEGDLIFDNINQANFLKDNNSYYLLEPALTVSGGLEKIKLQWQYGYSLNLTNSNFKQENLFLTIGLNFNFK